jgi:MFS family permease
MANSVYNEDNKGHQTNMIQTIIHVLLKRRHFWRYASFDEVAELYASRIMRILAQQMIGLFIMLYLYQKGYSLVFIAAFIAINFVYRALMAYPSARFIAKYGPKHGMLVANLLYIPALVAFTLVPHFGVAAIIGFGIFQSLSMVMYDVAYLVDFSKVKHVDHAGKEIGYMQILEQFAACLAPFVGGFVAYLISPEATMWLSAIFFAVAAIPLFKTREPVRLNQKLSFKGFPWRDTRRTIFAETAVGFDNAASLGIWTLFVAIVVFAGASNDIYLKIGTLTSITVATSFIAAYWCGRIIDWRHGGDLLKVGILADAMTHLFRVFITTPIGVAAVNISNQVATTSYSMAFMRGIFDTADDAKGYRIAYLSLISTATNIGNVIASSVLLVFLIMLKDPVVAMQLFYAVTALYVLLVFTAKFRLYR